MSNPLNQILEQAKALQSKISEKQQNLDKVFFTGEAGAGMVKITINCHNQALSIDIDDALFQEKKTVLQDLLVSAINDAHEKSKNHNQSNLANLTAGLDLDKIMGFK